MAQGLTALCVAVVSAVALADTADVTQDSLHGFEARTFQDLPYRLFKPAGYDPKKRYPVVLFLHGAGERGTDGRMHLAAAGANQLPLLFAGAEVQRAQPAFVVAPQCPPAPKQWVQWDWANGSYDLKAVPESGPLKKVRALLAALEKEFSIDPDRRYAVGLSMGGFGTWDLVLRNPKLWAAAIVTDGGGAPASAKAAKDVPVWIQHVADDAVVPVSGARAMFEAMHAAGGTATYTEYASGGHKGWVLASKVPDLAPWLFAQKRGVRGRSPADLAVAPNGGSFAPAATVTLASTVPGARLRWLYAEPAIATPETGALYEAPFVLPKPGALTAVAFTAPANPAARLTVFHATSFAASTRR